MQVFWISGPVGEIRSFNLSFKTIAIACLVLTMALLGAGGALQFFGFRIALEYDPQIARQLGDLYTANELESLNAVYRARLKNIENEQNELVIKVQELDATNSKLKAMLIPKSIVKSKPDVAAQGGPDSLKLSQNVNAHSSLLDSLSDVYALSRTRNKLIKKTVSYWSNEVSWLDGLPTGLPITQSNKALISSGFGARIDPMTRRRSFHPGLDFSMHPQTPILAAGTGVVIKAERDPEYGNQVLISHGDGILSRYAHANELLVRNGSRVVRGQVIARSGSTGRSTGPHLHFEVLKDNQVVDPISVLSIMRKSPSI